MLTKREQRVLRELLKRCGDGDRCLIDEEELSRLSARGSSVKLLDCLEVLRLEDYVEYVRADKKGKNVYCVSLKNKSFTSERENVFSRRELIFKLAFALLSGLLTYVFGRIMVVLFK